MADVNADAKDGFRRIELLTGPARRRRWSAAEKAQIVAETLIAGASVSDVARRWQVCSRQVFTWRREARAGHLVLPSEMAACAETSFVPIIAETDPETDKREGDSAATATGGAAKPSTGACIEVRLAGATIRVAAGADCTLLTDVLRALRKSAA
jgi:transposase